ncbi:CinA family nicotinamide mononucleotide deamidase-related protein [Salegentibacter sp. HM20]
MKAEIICIGDEILIGQVTDTNSGEIAKRLNKIGVNITRMSSIADERNAILNALASAGETNQNVIITGGLGPTRDDVTKLSLCEFFDDKMVENEEVYAHIEQLFKKYSEVPISKLNREQAEIPSKAEILFNKYGTAPGMWFEKEGVVYISLPGIPFEMKALMDEEVLPRLQQKFKFPFILHKTVVTYGLGESALADKIEDFEDSLPDYVTLAYLPNFGKVRLRLTATGENKEHLLNTLEGLVTGLHEIIGDIIVGQEEDEPVELLVGRMLSARGQSIATAESCTGGGIAKLFAAPPGASVYFKGSVVSYATKAKEEILKIPAEIIEKHSVVSAEVAEAMAKNVKEIFHSDYGLSTTGNAGPSKGDSEAEIGTVYIGIATPTSVFSRKFVFGNHRDKVIGKAIHKSLELIFAEVNSKK